MTARGGSELGSVGFLRFRRSGVVRAPVDFLSTSRPRRKLASPPRREADSPQPARAVPSRTRSDRGRHGTRDVKKKKKKTKRASVQTVTGSCRSLSQPLLTRAIRLRGASIGETHLRRLPVIRKLVRVVELVGAPHPGRSRAGAVAPRSHTASCSRFKSPPALRASRRGEETREVGCGFQTDALPGPLLSRAEEETDVRGAF